MSTGDVRGSLRKLDTLLRSIKYPRDVDYDGLSKGDPSAFLPIVNFTLTSFSPLLAEELVGAGLELTGKTDLRFTDTVYKVLRDIFQYKPVLSKQQFLQWGFSQRKICVVCDVINLVLQRYNHSKKTRSIRPASQSDNKVFVQQTDPDSLVHSGQALVVRHTWQPSPPTRSMTTSQQSAPHPSIPTTSHQSAPHPSIPTTSHQSADSAPHPSILTQLTAEYQEPTTAAVEGRLSALESQVESLLCGLDRLTALEQRLQRPESCRQPENKSQTITISREEWENMMSRVTLLETQLQLNNTQKENILVNEVPDRHHSPEPKAPQEDVKQSLDRIANLLKDTSNLLMSAEPVI